MEKENKPRAFRSFIKGFVITLLVMIPAYIGVYYFATGNLKTIESESASEAVTSLPVSAPKSYNLLFCVSDKATGGLAAATLLRFDTNDARVVGCVFPLSTVVLGNKAPATASEVFLAGGGEWLADSIEETFALPLSGYCSLDTEELAGLIDSLGEIEFSLEREIAVQNDEGLTVYSKSAGSGTFTGNDVAKLLVYGEYENNAAVDVYQRLLKAAIAEYGRDGLSSKLFSYYGETVDRLDTNISLSGAYALIKAVEYISCDGGVEYSPVWLEGSYAGGRFELNENAAQKMTNHFGKAIS